MEQPETIFPISVGECGLLGKKCGTVLPSSLLVNAPAPAVNAVPVTPFSMMPATRASRCTSDPRHPGRIWTAGVMVAAGRWWLDGGVRGGGGGGGDGG
ncbi:Os01g0724250 [Oryza sativa Japonica Group]|uniref:Os01g0724250 protein n=1 Tax=Oryza sativa subsp. japonica TaxID=39947 RepID=A0A0P0V7M6_ORYSJ|nr:Os01g0724250 [Oryza sativa Japonica Group]